MKRQVTIERMNEGGAERKWTLRFYLWNKKKMMTMMKGDVLLFPFSERDKIETPSSHVLLVVVPFICHVLLYFYSYFIPFLPFNFQILSTVPSKVLKEEEMEINIRFYFYWNKGLDEKVEKVHDDNDDDEQRQKLVNLNGISILET